MCKKFTTDKLKGLKSGQIEINSHLYGSNIISKRKGKSFFKKLIEALFDPMLIILEFAWFITVGINVGKYLKTGEGDFVECIGIFLAIAVSVVITLTMEGKSQKAFDLLNSVYDKVSVKVIRDGEITIVPKQNIVVGDVVLYEAGEKCVGDGVILSCDDLTVDQSTLTGESNPATKNCVDFKENLSFIQRKDCICSGSIILTGKCKVLTLAVGDKAQTGIIAEDLQQENNVSAPLKEKLSRLSALVTVIGVVSSVIVFALMMVRQLTKGGITFAGVEEAFMQSVILIVAAVPEGLPTTVAISLSLNVVKLAKSNALIKKLVATETVGCVSVICSDKTGTLTENAMTVEKLVSVDRTSEDYIIKNIIINSGCTVGSNLQPIGGNITDKCLIKYVTGLNNYQEYKDIPNKTKVIFKQEFSSDKKFSAVKTEETTDVTEYLKGAPEVLKEKCKKTKTIDYYYQKIICEQNKGKRVIAFAHKIEEEYVFDGYVTIEDPVRKDVCESVKSCLSAGIEVKILTGDNVDTARYVAQKCGILTEGKIILNAEETESMTDEQLTKVLKNTAVIARSLPSTKLRVVKLLKESGEVVAVTGDGVNDAPAIKHADIGISMGDGSEIAKEASDIVLLDNSFTTIVKAISFGRNVYNNFKSFIMFQLTVNLTAVIVIVSTLAMGLEAPFGTLQLLWINIIMDGPPALSLGLKTANRNNLAYSPVKRNDDIISFKTLCRILLHAVFISSIVILQTSTDFLRVGIEKQKTVVFTLFTVLQLLNAINCTEPGKLSIFSSLKNAKSVFGVITITFIVQVLITQFAGGLFNAVSLSLIDWVKTIVVGLSVILLSEGYKLLYRFTTNKKNRQLRCVKA